MTLTRARARLLALLMLLFVTAAACSSDDDDPAIETGDGDGTEQMDDAAVSFGSPADGDEVSSPVALTFTATGIEIHPAADAVEDGKHFHVMIDTDCVAEGEVIAADESHVHFGDGSTETELELEAGSHTLCLQAADNDHVATPYTHVITITVV
ncbi:MAG TPA: DUF4399 domain-containing protein [Acidimicrobiales bacterium]